MKTSHWFLSLIVPLACASCSADVFGEDEDYEEEPQGATQEELRSAVSCKEKATTGYRSGTPYAMKVITVGGKPTAKATAHAFLKMQAAAERAGVTLTISSGFRTMAEQQYFWNCYQTKKCNNGNLAARPGNSPHQNGSALDLAASNFGWLQSNASRFGFAKTVPSERWHYQFSGADPGGPCSGGASSDPAPADRDEGDVPTPTPRPDDADADSSSSSGCYSPTMAKTMEEGSCVQSSADDVFYQCHAGLWYRGVSGGKGRYGACTSTHAN